MSGFSLADRDWVFIGLVFEGFFCGIYSAIFALYLQHQASAEKKKTIIFYSLCILYVLSIALVVLDVAEVVIQLLAIEVNIMYYLTIFTITSALAGCCDFIGQSILIYRCWIVWNRNIRAVIIPSILVIAFLALWLAQCGATLHSQYQIIGPKWRLTGIMTSLALSLTTNALVTGLIVFKIFKVYSRAKPMYSGTTGNRKLRSTIFILIESGMTLFFVQLALVVIIILRTQTALNADQPINDSYQMLIGITPTIIQVRVAMGLSFHDEKSMIEVASSLHFVSNHANSIPETASIHQEWRDDVQRSNDSDIVEVRRDRYSL